jgi:hypothetical protein
VAWFTWPRRLSPARRVQKVGCGRWPAGSVDAGRYGEASFIPLRRPLPGAAKTRLPDAVPLHPAARDGCPRRRRQELEILVLRHQLTVLRRQTARPRLEPADRALLAAVSRALPRSRWSCFFVRPETLLGWHRRLVAGAWTYPHYQTGRPPLDQDVQQLIVRLARRTLAGATSGSRANCSTSASWSQRPRSVRCCAGTGWTRRHGGRRQPGGRSCASKPPGSSPVISSPSTRCGCGGCRCCSSSSWGPGGPLGRRDRPPGWAWVAQQARNLRLVLGEQARGVRFHDNPRRVLRRDRLSGLLHQYHRQAA